MADITLVQGNVGKVLTYRMMIPDPVTGQKLVPLDLKDATSIRFRMYSQPGCGTLLGGVGAVVNPPREGIVSYDVADADVAKPGNYFATFEAHFPNDVTVTLPENRYLNVLVMPRLGPAVP